MKKDLVQNTDYGHPERAFFQKFDIFGLGQTNWATSGQTISTILALWFLGLKHITPKYSQNKIWAVKNLEESLHTSVFGAYFH